MRIKHLLYAAAVAIVTMLACQKEVSDFRVTDPGTINTITVSATVTGRVVDETGTPVQGAVVRGGSKTAQTDINGEFRLSSATLAEKNAFVTVEKTGYFTGSRTFIAKAGQNHYVEIELLPKTSVGSVNTTTGGSLTGVSGNTITLPANGFVVKSTGVAYTGTVQVAMNWINPAGTNLFRQMPGDLRGINEAGAEMGLQSFGMMAVELSSPTGEALQIAPGKSASLRFPIPGTINGSAPATIPLWSFNDTTGLWKQEGTATKVGNGYTATVSHFSFWNCDAQFPVVSFSAKFVNQNGQPLQHVSVRLTRTSVPSSYPTYGYTDTAGNVSGLVPSNEPLKMEVFATSACNTAIYSQNIGPFSAATNLGTVTITLAAASSFTVTGSVVNCNNTPLTSGYVVVNTGSRIYRAPVSNGSFTLSFASCAATQAINYYAVDSSNSVQSTPASATLSTTTTNLGTLSACGVSTQRFINFTFNGAAYSLTAPPDSLMGGVQQGRSYLSGYKGTTATNMTALNADFVGAAVGTFALNSLYIRVPGFSDSTSVIPNSINVVVTEFGAVGAYIGGSFTGNVKGTGTNIYPIQCTFRVRRDY